MQVSIDLDALRYNFQKVRRVAPNSKIMAVVKANGYGHGMIKVAQALSEADAFAVSTLSEALVLKQAHISQPVVILEGFLDSEELNTTVEQQFISTVHSAYQLDLIEKSGLSGIKIWIKLDSGMHRLGFPLTEVQAIKGRLEQIDGVEIIGWMSQFSDADDLSNPKTQRQIDDFLQATNGLGGQRSLANSGGILGWPEAHQDWVRPGIMLYGASPFANRVASQLDLRAVMQFSARIMTVNHFHKGDRIGYGSSWTCPEDMPVGLVSAGYGDGYPRHASIGTPVLINHRVVPVIGRISMDMIMIDLRGQPDVTVGDRVILWGGNLPVDKVADSATTIPNELLCGVTQRVDRG